METIGIATLGETPDDLWVGTGAYDLLAPVEDEADEPDIEWEDCWCTDCRFR